MKITIKKIGDVAVPAHESDIEKWNKFSDAEYVVDMKNLDSRTSAQNRALHLYFTHIADALNSAGLTMNVALNKSRDERTLEVFDWARNKLSIVPGAVKVLNKMEEWILGAEYQDSADVEWTTLTVKELIWKKIQIAQLGKDSTTKLCRSDIDKIYDNVNRFLSNRFGIHIAFPSRELWEEKEK